MEDKTSQVSFVVYEGKCKWGENYIGETGQNFIIRWDEQSDIGKNSEAAKHLYRFREHIFKWKILRRVPNKVRQRKFDEAYYVVYLHPTLNNQLELTSLTLFRNGVWQKNVFKLLLVSPGFYRLKYKCSYILIYIYIYI